MYLLQDTTVIYTSRRGEKVTALNKLNLHIKEGEYLSIIGSSGSGKSTLLLTLGGMLAPQSGEVIVDNKSLYKIKSEERATIRNKKIGMVFQTFNLVPYLTALENVQLPLFLKGVSEEQQFTIAQKLLQQVGLADRIAHLPSELSVGQQQRVALARTLANDPQIILADEPTGSLDPDSGTHMLEFLKQCNKAGKTVVLVTHDPAAASEATRHMRLEEGILAETAAKA